MRTMKNMAISNTDFINWVFSLRKSRRFTMIDNIGKSLVMKGLSSGKIVRALKHLHTHPSVAVKRLSSKEIVSHNRKKKKLIIKSKQSGSTNKTESIDNSVKENNDFSPIITSIRSLQNDKEFQIIQSKNVLNPTFITEKQCELPLDKHIENTNIDNPSISSSENNQQLFEEKKNVSIGKSEGIDLLKVNELVNKSKDGGDETRQTEDLYKRMPGRDSVESKDIIVDNVFNNKSSKQNTTIPQTNELRLQNNPKNDISSKDQITKLQEKIKLNLINKSLRGLNNNLEEKIRLNLSNDRSSFGVREPKEDSSGSKNSSNNTLNIREVVQLKEASHYLDKQDKPISNNANENETNKTVNTEVTLPLNTEEIKFVNNVQDQSSTCNESRTVTKKNVEKEQSEEPLNKESLHTDQVRVNKSLKHKNVKVTNTNYKETDKKKSLNSSKNSEQKVVIKGLLSQAKYLEECLIAKKRGAKLDLEIPKTKKIKISTEKLDKKNVIIDSMQNLNEKSQKKLKETFGDFRKIVDNLEEVLTSTNKQQNISQTHTITTLDKRQPNNILGNDESPNVEVKSGPKIHDSLVQNKCNSEGKGDNDSENAISDCTVSSSSMIETPLETCISRHIESTVDADIPVIVPLSLNEEDRVYVDAEENFDGVVNKQYLLSGNLYLLSSQSLIRDEKLINDSVNLYLNYFGKPLNSFTSVPLKIQQAIKNSITSKDHSAKGNVLTVNAVIKEYLTLYTTHFHVVNNKIVNKTAEVLHLAIADYNRREERTKLALRLNSDTLRNEEINRANCDYEEILKLRGAKFSEMFRSVLNKFEKNMFLLMTVTFFFKINQALLHIDSDNIKYFKLVKKLIVKLLTTNNQECPCYSFVNLPDSELESNYQFVKNCLVTYYLTRYRQDKSDTGSTFGFRFAFFGSTSIELRNMVSELINKYKPDLDEMFVFPSSCTNELTNTSINVDSTQHTLSLTQNEKSDPRGMIQTEPYKESNINSVLESQIYQKDDEVLKSSEKQILKNLQKLPENQETTHESHFNLQEQTYFPKEQFFQAISKNQLLSIQKPNQQQDMQPQTFSHNHFVVEPLQHQRFQFAGQPLMTEIPLQRPQIQSYGQIPHQQQLNQATSKTQLIRTSLQQPNAHSLTQQKLSNISPKDPNIQTQNKLKQKTQSSSTSIIQNGWLLPKEQNPNNPTQNQMNLQGFQYPTPSVQTVTNQQNSELSRQNQLLQLQHRVEANKQKYFTQFSGQRQPLPRNLITVSQQPTQVLQTKQIPTQFSGQRQPLPRNLITVSQQPTQVLQTKQIPNPSTQMSSSSTVNTRPSVSQVQNMFKYINQRESLQQSVGLRANETMDQTIVTNTSQLQPVSQPPTYNAHVRPRQYSWPNQQVQHSQRRTNPETLQPTNGNAFTVEERFGSRMCAVRECGQQATIACSLCMAVFYCSYDCQRNDWYNSHSADACGLTRF